MCYQGWQRRLRYIHLLDFVARFEWGVTTVTSRELVVAIPCAENQRTYVLNPIH